MAYFSEAQLPRYREEDLPGTVKKLYNFCRELQEMLQFVLSNLDADNIEGYEEIFNRLTDADGNISILKQTAEEILMQVRRNEGQLGELSVKADGISARVQDNEKGIAELKVTADGISQRVADNEKNLSSVTQTASSISQRVANAEGDISTLEQTASGLRSRVSSVEGSMSSVEQTANGLSSRVTSMEGSLSTVQQTANGLTSTVSDLNGKYTQIKQTVDSIRAICAKTFIHEIYTKREYNEKKEMVKMLHNEARKLLVEGYERTHDVHGIAKAYGVTEREVYRLVKQKRDTGSVELRTSQRGRKPKMTEKDLERLRAAIEKTPDKTLGELKEELNLPCSESRLSRIVREKLGFRRKKKVIHASEQERPRCTGKA